SPIFLTAGMPVELVLTVEKVTSSLSVHWERKGRGWEVIPPAGLYSAVVIGHVSDTYVRFLKTASLATGLKLTSNEMVYLATTPDYQVDGQGSWLNVLPVSGSPDGVTAQLLLERLDALLVFARIKSALSPDDERLLTVLEQPSAILSNGDSLMLSMTR